MNINIIVVRATSWEMWLNYRQFGVTTDKTVRRGKVGCEEGNCEVKFGKFSGEYEDVNWFELWGWFDNNVTRCYFFLIVDFILSPSGDLNY